MRRRRRRIAFWFWPSDVTWGAALEQRGNDVWQRAEVQWNRKSCAAGWFVWDLKSAGSFSYSFQTTGEQGRDLSFDLLQTAGSVNLSICKIYFLLVISDGTVSWAYNQRNERRNVLQTWTPHLHSRLTFLELFQTFVVVPVISLCSGHSVLLCFLVRWQRRCEAHPTGLGQSNSLMQDVSDSGLEPFT